VDKNKIMIKDKLVADVRDEHIGELDNENNDDNIEWQLKKDGNGEYPLVGYLRRRGR
jgi:hypothetical protein